VRDPPDVQVRVRVRDPPEVREGTILVVVVVRMEVNVGISICELRHVSDKYQSFILQVLEHDWLDEKVISDVTIESSRQNLS